ncbi:septal ring lytic transglycosylase RlpA family protein [Larsenimonas salina]|uniref:septal ring lytic transglycosylase RlpA family protein n=1 Tax=Larsenimonas salina TaxID=1295565 RepID=UPI0020747069|nr:septal ring lytic transglycosylase RlpA family protein [Larsenimonas salina]MCM5704418.1 septal ring lytic transglycosylase RlpA family protein [Larsenimonas salina]
MIQHARNVALGAGLLLSLAGCAGHQVLDAGSVERGEASYYAERYNGRTTASGERLDTAALTAAHRRLPFGTRVEVTNLDTDQSVEVRINDRGPFTRGRIIDLTPAAARRIGLTESGVAPVAVQVTQRP